MKSFRVVLWLAALWVCASAAQAQSTYKYLAIFKDKNGTPYSIEHPEAFLSAAAIERRVKLHIPIDETDLPVNPDYVKQVKKVGVKLLNKTKWINGVTFQTNDKEKVDEIRNLPFIKEVRKVGKLVKPKSDGMENEIMDQESMSQTPVNDYPDMKSDELKEYGMSYNQIKMLNGINLHKQGFTGKGVNVAVLDAGFFHVNKMRCFDQNLFEGGHLLGCRDFVTGDTLVFEDDTHGLMVLSCMAANWKGKMVGTAPDAKYWLIRTEDAFSEYPIEECNWATGAEFADSAGVDVINTSLGYTVFDLEEMNHSYSELNGKTSIIALAATMAARKGIIVCASAGNEGDGTWHYLGTPGDADSILTVGACNPYEEIAPFSSFGYSSDGRIKPNVTAQGRSSTVSGLSNNFVQADGTSFSSPILCGMVACLRGANPTKTVLEIITAIELSASQYATPDPRFGHGIPDFALANRILGGDKEHPFTALELTDIHWLKEKQTFNAGIYAPNSGKMDWVLMNEKGKKKGKGTREIVSGYTKWMPEKLKKLKPGTYTLEVTMQDKTSKITFTVR